MWCEGEGRGEEGEGKGCGVKGRAGERRMRGVFCCVDFNVSICIKLFLLLPIIHSIILASIYAHKPILFFHFIYLLVINRESKSCT